MTFRRAVYGFALDAFSRALRALELHTFDLRRRVDDARHGIRRDRAGRATIAHHEVR